MKTPQVMKWSVRPQSSQSAFVLAPEKIDSEAVSIGVWLHSATGTPEELIDEALTYVNDGAISVVVDAPYSHSRLGLNERGPGHVSAERRLWRNTAWELSIILNELQNEFPIDLSTSFAVGFNLGGSQIAWWLAEDRRIKTAVVSGAIPSLSSFWVNSQHSVAKKFREKYKNEIELYSASTADFDLVQSVKQLHDARMFFQYGRNDNWIESSSVDELLKTINPEQHHISWNTDSHDMQHEISRQERAHFLRQLTSNPRPRLNISDAII